MNLCPTPVHHADSKPLILDKRFAEIAKLLDFKATLPAEELHKILSTVYDSLSRTGIVNQDGSINEKDIFAHSTGGNSRRLLPDDIANSLYFLDYNSELECGIIKWSGLISIEEYKTGNESFLQLARQHNAKKMIRDAQNFTILSPLSRKWFTEYVIPQFLMAGIKYSAVIAPHNQLSNRIVKDIIQETNPEEIDVRLFSTMDEAKSWIASV